MGKYSAQIVGVWETSLTSYERMLLGSQKSVQNLLQPAFQLNSQRNLGVIRGRPSVEWSLAVKEGGRWGVGGGG